MRFHIGRNMTYGGLEIYATNEAGTKAMVIDSVDEHGTISVREVEVDEAVMPPVFMRLGGPYAEALEDGFKRHLSRQEHIVPKEVYEREAGRVDALIETVRTVAVASVMGPPPTEVRLERDTFR